VYHFFFLHLVQISILFSLYDLPGRRYLSDHLGYGTLQLEIPGNISEKV
jgi:hypothetical protein